MIQKYFNKNPLNKFYNLNGLDNVALTCDVDWAPDYAIEKVLETIQSFGFKINIFATHNSSVLQQKYNFANVGIHPNFTKLSNNSNFEDEIKRLKDFFPDSSGIRAHRNFFGQNIADIAHKYNFKYDASVFLWNQSFCQAHIDYNGMVRFSYFWEDGIHLDTNSPFEIKFINLHTPGLKILNIHPILFYLNTITDDERREVTSQYSNLTTAPKNQVDKYINKGFGIGSFYIEILNYLKSNLVETHFLEDLSDVIIKGNI